MYQKPDPHIQEAILDSSSLLPSILNSLSPSFSSRRRRRRS